MDIALEKLKNQLRDMKKCLFSMKSTEIPRLYIRFLILDIFEMNIKS